MRIAVVVAYVLAAGVCPAQSNAPSSSTDAPAVPKPVCAQKDAPAADGRAIAGRPRPAHASQPRPDRPAQAAAKSARGYPVRPPPAEPADRLARDAPGRRDDAELTVAKAGRLARGREIGAAIGRRSSGPCRAHECPGHRRKSVRAHNESSAGLRHKTPRRTTRPRTRRCPRPISPRAGSDGPPGTMTWHRLVTFERHGGETNRSVPHPGQDMARRVAQPGQTGKSLREHQCTFHQRVSARRYHSAEGVREIGLGRRQNGTPRPGNYYLKIEASGGSWELAVEDFR